MLTKNRSALTINIEPEISGLFSQLSIACIETEVKVVSSDRDLTNYMEKLCESLKGSITNETIRMHPVVEMTKRAYRKMGQDPNRYRPAAESLLRRIAGGKGLYYVNNMVDILNIVSIRTGFSIGGYDKDKISGEISFGIGRAGEDYQGIGRGELNIENLPVFRDEIGAFGTSTSDSVRTMVDENTRHFLMVIPSFEDTGDHLEKAIEISEELLAGFARVKSVNISIQGTTTGKIVEKEHLTFRKH